MTSVELFENSLEWLKKNYSRHKFYLERDIVYTLQTHLNEIIAQESLPLKVYNDYPILPGIRADLVINSIDENNKILDLAAELKYEPKHDKEYEKISKGKYPVVVWNEVLKDIERARQYVNAQKARRAYSILIDEENIFRDRKGPFPDNAWEKSGNIAILTNRF